MACVLCRIGDCGDSLGFQVLFSCQQKQNFLTATSFCPGTCLFDYVWKIPGGIGWADSRVLGVKGIYLQPGIPGDTSAISPAHMPSTSTTGAHTRLGVFSYCETNCTDKPFIKGCFSFRKEIGFGLLILWFFSEIFIA